MAGKPLSRFGASCTAIKKTGERCQSKKTYAGNKCRFHGGLSTGPKTPEGWSSTRAGFRQWVDAGCPPNLARRARKESKHV